MARRTLKARDVERLDNTSLAAVLLAFDPSPGGSLAHAADGPCQLCSYCSACSQCSACTIGTCNGSMPCLPCTAVTGVCLPITNRDIPTGPDCICGAQSFGGSGEWACA